MAKVQKVFACTSCGTTYSKWAGQCSACEEWNTIQEEIVVKESPKQEAKKMWRKGTKKEKPRPKKLAQIETGTTQRRATHDGELNRVLGGGIVEGSMVLLGGEPGIGKSTLMLQLALSLDAKVLYISGEESEEQIKMRANRLGKTPEHCYIMSDTSLANVLMQAQLLEPNILIIDSIQTITSAHIESAPGSVSQVRECATEFQRFAKESGVPVFIIGHITKEGAIAGPKVLEHIVDVVLQFEGDRNYTHRILRTIKNRFGSTSELGIYEMQGIGLREVSNPSELLLSQKEEDLSGSAIAATLEGIRPMLIETQALVSTAVYSSPQRSATGFDLRRLGMLLAVLEKRCGFQFASNDIFLNIAGGIKVSDPAIDLAIISALISSLEDVSLPSNICFAGEIGLSGEIRSVQRAEQRIQEANRLGFEQIFVSRFNMKGIDQKNYDIEIIPVGKVEELYNILFA
ncbi:DNA repair protein RadA [Aureispira anguillae]|uniref:DNA repair protein RadA n=1 Tax=Aureispira anguillae TaxID=2864201 RepID=A0A915YLQ0_9BACT|nr:DNA repair protein RadA [Aureispira anguillae]BDS15063.1 DNA repair protein RadA [Aureispira anguillae]